MYMLLQNLQIIHVIYIYMLFTSYRFHGVIYMYMLFQLAPGNNSIPHIPSKFFWEPLATNRLNFFPSPKQVNIPTLHIPKPDKPEPQAMLFAEFKFYSLRRTQRISVFLRDLTFALNPPDNLTKRGTWQ